MNERQELNIKENGSADYVIAGLLGFLAGGPVTMGLSLLALKVISTFSGQKQKWLLWAIVGSIATPVVNIVQLVFLSAIVAGTSPDNDRYQEQINSAPKQTIEQVTTSQDQIVTSRGVRTLVSPSGLTRIYAKDGEDTWTYQTTSETHTAFGYVTFNTANALTSGGSGTFRDSAAGSHFGIGCAGDMQIIANSDNTYTARWDVKTAIPNKQCPDVGQVFAVEGLR